MFDLKECRHIKRECTKKHEGKNIIIDVSQYPLMYLIVTHGDGKSWGYFFNYDKDSNIKFKYYLLGRSNSEISGLLFNYKKNCVNTTYNSIVVSDNERIKEAYNKLLDSIKTNVNFYNYYDTTLDLLFVNPQLFCNLVDSNVCNIDRSWDYSNGYCAKYSNISNLVRNCCNEQDLSKPLIKDAFKMSAKWVRAKVKSGISFKRVLLLKDFGYAPEYVSNLSYYTINSIEEKWLRNKKIVEKALDSNSGYYYRDYLRVLDLLPEELAKDFPICPENVRKYHDRALNVYNNHKQMIEALRAKERNDKYLKEVYPSAVKYEFENDDYTIIACKQLEDLTKEGASLRHCVGTYINSVSEGKEYILFLREKSDIDKSYFTIDLTPDKKVRQIHGYCNCNMNEDVRPFINEWAKKFNLELAGCSGIKCALCWYFLFRI